MANKVLQEENKHNLVSSSLCKAELSCLGKKKKTHGIIFCYLRYFTPVLNSYVISSPSISVY